MKKREIIPSQHMEIESIFYHTLNGNKRSIAITSTNPGEGVSTLALALTQRHLLAGHRTLLVDLTLQTPTLQTLFDDDTSTTELLSPPQLINIGNGDATVMGVVAPKRRETILKLRKPGVLETVIQQWLEEYELVIIDTIPFNAANSNNIPTERICAACESTLLTILCGVTTAASIEHTTEQLKAGGATLSGTLLNDRDNPSLRSELLREVRRITPLLPRTAERLGQWIKQSRLLSLAT